MLSNSSRICNKINHRFFLFVPYKEEFAVRKRMAPQGRMSFLITDNAEISRESKKERY